MPKLNQLTCSLELKGNDAKLREYGTKYDDAQVRTYVPVPKEQKLFSIHLTSESYVAPGLAMFVYIDGQYQCNRSRLDLPEPAEGVSPSSYQVDLRVRQKEERQPNGEFIGREWSFHALNLVTPEKADNISKEFLKNVGTIEVVVLRCKKSESSLHVRSSSLTDPAIPEPNTTKLLITQPSQRTALAPPKAPSPKAPSPKAPSKAPSTKAPSSKPVSRKAESSVGGLMGLFDGAADYNLDGVPYDYGRNIDPNALHAALAAQAALRNQNPRGPEFGGDIRPHGYYEPDRTRAAPGRMPFPYDTGLENAPRIQDLASGLTEDPTRRAGQPPIVIHNHYHGSARPSRAPSLAPSLAPSHRENKTDMRAGGNGRHDFTEQLRQQRLPVQATVAQHNRVRSEPNPPRAQTTAHGDDLLRKLAAVEARLGDLFGTPDGVDKGKRPQRAVSVQGGREGPHYEQYRQARAGARLDQSSLLNADETNMRTQENRDGFFNVPDDTWKRKRMETEDDRHRDGNAQPQRTRWNDGARSDPWTDDNRSPKDHADPWEAGEMRYSDILRQRQRSQNRPTKPRNGVWGGADQQSIPGAWPGEENRGESVGDFVNWWKDSVPKAAGKNDWNVPDKRTMPNHDGRDSVRRPQRNDDPGGNGEGNGGWGFGSPKATWNTPWGAAGGSQSGNNNNNNNTSWGDSDNKQSGKNDGWNDQGNKQSNTWGNNNNNKNKNDKKSNAGDDWGNWSQSDNKDEKDNHKDNQSHHGSDSKAKNEADKPQNGDNWGSSGKSNAGGNNWEDKPQDQSQNQNQGWGQADNNANNSNGNNNDNNGWGSDNDQQKASDNTGSGWNTTGNANNNANNDNWGSGGDQQQQNNDTNNTWGNNNNADKKSDNNNNDTWGNKPASNGGKAHSSKQRRSAKSTAGATEASFELKSYWSAWNKPPTPPPSKPRNPFKYPAEPLPAISTAAINMRSISAQVQIGAGADFVHDTARPEYIDSMERPYAVFGFRYRSVGYLEKKFGVRIEDDPLDLKAKVLTMSKRELVEDFIRRKMVDEKKKGEEKPKGVVEKVKGWDDGNQGKAATVADDKVDGWYDDVKSSETHSYTYLDASGDENSKQGGGQSRNGAQPQKNTGWDDKGGESKGGQAQWDGGAQNGGDQGQGSAGVEW